MSQEQRVKTKAKIMTVIKRSGIPIRTQTIAQRVRIPDDEILHELLTELVKEGRLIERHTLLVNGEVGHLYDLRPTH